MTIRTGLHDATTAVLASIGASRTDLNKPSSGGRKARLDAVYEAFLFSEVVNVLRGLGYHPIAVPPSPVFRIRRAPGAIWTTPANASYVRFTCTKRKYDLLIDVEVMSRSPGATLELDIAGVGAGQAEECRTSRRHPSYRSMRLAIEAKFYSGSVGTSQAKEFIGIADRVKCPQCLAAFVCSGPLTSNARQLLTGSKLACFSEVLPVKRCAAGRKAFVAYLQHKIPKVF